MTGNGKRGFAKMDQEKQRQIASKGGKAAHQKGRAHEFTPEEARVAGRKGGLATHQRYKARALGMEEARQENRTEDQAGQLVEAHTGNGLNAPLGLPAESEEVRTA